MGDLGGRGQFLCWIIMRFFSFYVYFFELEEGNGLNTCLSLLKGEEYQLSCISGKFYCSWANDMHEFLLHSFT